MNVAVVEQALKAAPRRSRKSGKRSVTVTEVKNVRKKGRRVTADKEGEKKTTDEVSEKKVKEAPEVAVPEPEVSSSTR